MVAAVTVAALSGESPSLCPVIGSSQFRKRSPMLKQAAREDRAEGQHDHRDRHRLGGLVRVRLAVAVVPASGCRARGLGERVGWFLQRSSPKNVISITRVM